MGYTATPSPINPDEFEVVGTGPHEGFSETITLDSDVHGVARELQLAERFVEAAAS